MTSLLNLMVLGVVLVLVPLLLAVPWLAALDPETFQKQARRKAVWGLVLGGVIVWGILAGLVLYLVADRDRLELLGRFYGSLVQLFLSVTFFVGVLAGMLLIWPRGGAVALVAFREAIRQPLFWLLTGLTAFFIFVSVAIPYFTFGDDYKMMKLIGFETIVLVAGLFGIVTTSMSISDEIEGRTAITLLSKPLSRRQFLLGKFSGILLAVMALAALTGWCLNWGVYLKPMIDFEQAADPLQDQLQPALVAGAHFLAPGREAGSFLQGAAAWFGGSLALLPGLVIGCCQVMIFLAIAAALATRIPMVVNLLTCLVIFYLGNLAPFLVQLADNIRRQWAESQTAVSQTALDLVQFTAKLADTILPALEYFGLGPAIIREQPLFLGPYALHVLYVVGYSILYTAIALLLGLILFEDRDLA
jgi:ABC-type transport system involved in multi-copper enzyme maturation permease subunit